MYRPGDLRQQAQDLLADEAWQREFADAMTTLRDNLDSWTWEEESPNQPDAVNIWAKFEAEIRLAQAAFPEQPFYVIKIDLKDYYPSIPRCLMMKVIWLKQEQSYHFKMHFQEQVICS